MNRTPDLDLVLRDYLADDGGAARDYVLDVVADRISRQPQRRSWPFPGRTTVTQLKLAAALAAAVIITVVGYNVLPRQPSTGAPSSAPSPSPTTNPTGTPVPTGPTALPEGVLAAGRYRIRPSDDPLGLSLVADIPAGWQGFPETPALLAPGADNSSGVLIAFMKVSGLFSDPCHWDVNGSGLTDQPGDVEVGPSADALVAALRANKAYTATSPTPVTIGGFQGKVLELQLPGSDVLDTCDSDPTNLLEHRYFVFAGGFYAQAPNSRWRLFIVDAAGTRLVTMISYFDANPQADIDAGQAIVESLQITP